MSQAFAHFTTIYYKIWIWGTWKSYVYIYLILLFNSQTIITFIYYILKRKTIDMLENLTNKKHILHFNLTDPLLISEPQKGEKKLRDELTHLRHCIWRLSSSNPMFFLFFCSYLFSSMQRQTKACSISRRSRAGNEWELAILDRPAVQHLACMESN